MLFVTNFDAVLLIINAIPSDFLLSLSSNF